VPNPATGEVRVQWTPEQVDAVAMLHIHDARGWEVATLMASAGVRSLTWNTVGLPGGYYYVTLTCGIHSATTPVLMNR
jgi:hypothetical protein